MTETPRIAMRHPMIAFRETFSPLNHPIASAKRGAVARSVYDISGLEYSNESCISQMESRFPRRIPITKLILSAFEIVGY